MKNVISQGFENLLGQGFRNWLRSGISEMVTQIELTYTLNERLIGDYITKGGCL